MALDEKLSRADQLLISTATALVIPLVHPGDNDRLLYELMIEVLPETSQRPGPYGELVSACEELVKRHRAGVARSVVDDARFAVRSRLQAFFFQRVGHLYDAWRVGSVG